MDNPVMPELMPAYESKLAALRKLDEDYFREVRDIAGETYKSVTEAEQETVKALVGADMFSRLHAASGRWLAGYVAARTEYDKEWWNVYYGEEWRAKNVLRGNDTRGFHRESL